MSPFLNNTLCLSLLVTIALTKPCSAQTPAPATEIQFKLPLADKTTATTVLLPTADGKVWLVYTTPTGKIGLWTMTQATNPTPTPPPNPIPTPTPPEPPKPVSVSVITVTETNPAPCPALVAEFLRAAKSDYFAFTVAMVADPLPPANSLTWIGRTAGKTYPYSFVASPEGKALWEGPTPKDPTDFVAILQKLLTPIGVKDICTGNSCPTKKARLR